MEVGGDVEPRRLRLARGVVERQPRGHSEVDRVAPAHGALRAREREQRVGELIHAYGDDRKPIWATHYGWDSQAAGVGALYLAPSMSGTSYQAGLPPVGDRPSGAVSGRATLTPQSRATGVNEIGDAAAGAGQPTGVYPADPDPRPSVSDRERRSARGNSAFDPKQTKDEEPPAPVAAITPAEATAERLRLTWPRATDNEQVGGYRIWLNGYEVATTAETQVTLRWFNDDAGKHVVQIKAIDAAGNTSASSPT